MAKKPRTQLISALSHHIPQSEWMKDREKERISYPEGPPDRASWKTPGTYEPKELQYRGQRRPEAKRGIPCEACNSPTTPSADAQKDL